MEADTLRDCLMKGAASGRQERQYKGDRIRHTGRRMPQREAAAARWASFSHKHHYCMLYTGACLAVVLVDGEGNDVGDYETYELDTPRITADAAVGDSRKKEKLGIEDGVEGEEARNTSCCPHQNTFACFTYEGLLAQLHLICRTGIFTTVLQTRLDPSELSLSRMNRKLMFLSKHAP